MLDGWHRLLRAEEEREGGRTDSGLCADDVYNLYVDVSAYARDISSDCLVTSEEVALRTITERVMPALYGYNFEFTRDEVDLD